MKSSRNAILWCFYTALAIGTASVSLMGYQQVMTVRSEKTVDLSTWLSKKQIIHQMNLHGTDVLKITADEVFIHRGSRWIPVMRRDRG